MYWIPASEDGEQAVVLCFWKAGPDGNRVGLDRPSQATGHVVVADDNVAPISADVQVADLVEVLIRSRAGQIEDARGHDDDVLPPPTARRRCSRREEHCWRSHCRLPHAASSNRVR